MRLTIKTKEGKKIRFDVPTMKELVELLDKYLKGELKKEVQYYET